MQTACHALRDRWDTRSQLFGFTRAVEPRVRGREAHAKHGYVGATRRR